MDKGVISDNFPLYLWFYLLRVLFFFSFLVSLLFFSPILSFLFSVCLWLFNQKSFIETQHEQQLGSLLLPPTTLAKLPPKINLNRPTLHMVHRSFVHTLQALTTINQLEPWSRYSASVWAQNRRRSIDDHP